MLIRGQWKLYFYGLLSLNFDDHLISWTEAARQFTESYGQQILVLMKPKYWFKKKKLYQFLEKVRRKAYIGWWNHGQTRARRGTRTEDKGQRTGMEF